MIISGFSFIVMHSAAKFLSNEIHIFEITFLRCALVIVVLSPIIFKDGKSTFVTKQPKFQLYRIITNSKLTLCQLQNKSIKIFKLYKIPTNKIVKGNMNFFSMPK